MSKNLTSTFEQDAGALQVQDEHLAGVANLARRAKLLEKEIEDMESVLGERKSQQKKLLEETIPAVLSEMGMKSFRWQMVLLLISNHSTVQLLPKNGAARHSLGYVIITLGTLSRIQ